ncbi:MAG: M56 family metallopeptidase [Bacteroidota bacterium]
MEVFGIYLLKTSTILFVFWTIYVFFLQRETTFAENRIFLLLGALTAVLLPFLKIRKTILVELLPNTTSNVLANENLMDMSSGPLDWPSILFWTYLLGGLVFAFRFGLQLYSIKRLTKNAHIWKEEDLMHVETKNKIAPFSFFKSLFYHPKQFGDSQLHAILQHEKAHARQWHSADIIFSELLKILLWFNPLIWVYQRTIRQNLEFLADAQAVGDFNKKSYQYLMVNQVIGQEMPITNSFYNSLIKKRIVMLNKSQSKRMNALKSLFVIPLLAIFLVSFGTEKVYQFKTNSNALVEDYKVEVVINKNTSDEELFKIKTDLAKDGIDFSYTTVRNKDKEITDISLQVSGEGENGASFKNSHNTSNSEHGISPVVVFIDLENNLVSIGTKGAYKPTVTKIKRGEGTVWISSSSDDQVNVWNALDEIGEHEDIVITKGKGKGKIFINGEEIDKDEMHEHNTTIFIEKDVDGSDNSFSFYSSSDADKAHKKQVKIAKKKSKKGKSVMVIKDSDDDSDIEVINKDEGFFFIDTDGKEPLYIIDGKESSKKEVKKLSPKKIASMNILKGQAALDKYGPKAKNGVVEITLKK